MGFFVGTIIVLAASIWGTILLRKENNHKYSEGSEPTYGLEVTG